MFWNNRYEGKSLIMINIVKHENDLTNNNLLVIYLLIFAIILTPDIIIKGIPAFRVEQLIVIVNLIYLFIKLTLGKSLKKNNSGFAIIYLGFSFFIILSILVGTFKGIQVIVNDFFELYKILVYLGVYLTTVSFTKSEKDKTKVLKCINFVY